MADRVEGKKLVYLYRILSKAATEDGATISFVTENSRSKSKDSDSTATKDGTIVTSGTSEGEVTSTSYLAADDELIDALEEAMDANEKIEIWEVNLAKPASGQTNKFEGRYFQGYLTELELSSDAEDYVEASTTFGLEGDGIKGNVTVTAEQQEVASYAFADTPKTGA